jgi:hypothetical protein
VVRVKVEEFSFEISAKAQMTVDSLFMVTYSPGPSWDESKNPKEQSFFKEHSGRLI